MNKEFRIEVIAPNRKIGGEILEAWRERVILFNNKYPAHSFRDDEHRNSLINKEGREFASYYGAIFESIDGVHRFFYTGKAFIPHRAPVDIFQQFGVS